MIDINVKKSQMSVSCHSWLELKSGIFKYFLDSRFCGNDKVVCGNNEFYAISS